MNDTLNISDRANLRGIDTDLQAVIKMAADMGWRGKRSKGRGGITLLSPDGHTTVYVPNGHQDTTLKSTLARRVVRSTPQETRDAHADSIAVMPDDQLRDTAVAVSMAQGPLGIRPGALEPEPEVEEFVEVVQVEQHEQEKHVISEAPFVAKAGPGRKYASNAIITRTWSDGSVDYRCATPGCEQVYSSVPQFAGHGRAHGRKPPPVYVKADDGRDPHVERLAREIKAALEATDGDLWDQGELHVALAEHIITKRRERGEVHDVEPLTNDDIVARIRTMVSADIVREQVTLAETVTQLSVKLAEAQSAEQRMRETLTTFMSLAAEATGGSDDDSHG